MSDNRIDPDLCTECGLCAEACPGRVIEQTESGVRFHPGRVHVCIRCGHCMAICPTRAVQIEGFSYENDFFDLPRGDFGEAFFHLIATRRSVRVFKDRPVSREVLQKVVEAISMAPMGVPPHKVEITVVQDKQVLERALARMVGLYEKLVGLMDNPVTRWMIKRRIDAERFAAVHDHLVPVMKVRLPLMRATGVDNILRGAPVLIVFHAGRRTEGHSEDLLIDLTYGLLAAHALGLGATAIGLVPQAIERDKPLRELLGIPAENEAIAAMVVGYPRYRFQRGIRREVANVMWI